MALRWGSEARIDLLTIDGAPGGTGMSPWPMMNEWGIPTFYLQALAIEFANKLTHMGLRVPDLAMGGGFSDETHIFRALAMAAPSFKAVCMGRALMIPGMLGKNISGWPAEGKLPKTVSRYGATPGGDLRLLPGGQERVQRSYQRPSARRHRHRHLRPEDPHGAAAVDGGKPQLQPRDRRAARPHVTHRGMCRGVRHPVPHGCLPRRGREDPRRKVTRFDQRILLNRPPFGR